MLVAGVVRHRRQGQQCFQVPLQSLTYRLSVTPQPGFEPPHALLLEVGVQGVEALKRRYGYHEVPPDIPHQTFHLPLVVPLTRTAEPVIEQVVGLQLGEHPGPLTPAVPQYLCHRKRGVVVHNALRYSAQERKG